MASIRTSRRILSQHIGKDIKPRIFNTHIRTYTITQLNQPDQSKQFHRPTRHSQSYTSKQFHTKPYYRKEQNQETPSSGSTPPPTNDSGIAPSKIYSFEEIKSLSETPSPTRILIDVREPSEILGTGRIPTARNIPISSAADSFFLPAEEFEDKFGFDRPGPDQEVVFYCKAGVRSKAAARLASQAGFGGKVGEFPGSWVEWFDRGGKVDRSE